jgi:hypothetical protein
LKTRTRDVEETLARMIYDDDPVIAATAIDLVRDRGLWSLADDLEQILQFRDAKDWAVFEAASHALAARRKIRGATIKRCEDNRLAGGSSRTPSSSQQKKM